MKYKDELTNTMKWLGEKDNLLFIGQGVGHNVGGTFMSSTLDLVPKEKKLEFVLAEQFQMQFSLGLSIAGYTVVSQFPRQNFLLLGLGDLVNVLDKITNLSEQKFSPHVLIRTAVGTTKPIFPGIQHAGSFENQIRYMLTTVKIIKLTKTKEIFSAYKNAYENKGVTVLIEIGDLYDS